MSRRPPADRPLVLSGGAGLAGLSYVLGFSFGGMGLLLAAAMVLAPPDGLGTRLCAGTMVLVALGAGALVLGEPRSVIETDAGGLRHVTYRFARRVGEVAVPASTIRSLSAECREATSRTGLVRTCDLLVETDAGRQRLPLDLAPDRMAEALEALGQRLGVPATMLRPGN